MTGPRIGSLFSGAGMLDEGVRAVLGGEVVWHAEHEPPTEKNPRPTQAAARVLAYRYPGVPNLGDVSVVDWSTVPAVDVMTGGFPCQDVSLAGVGAGLRRGENRSGQWAYFAQAIAALRPSLVVIENVRGLLSAEADSELEPCPLCVGDADGVALRALGAVLGDLADIGYDARWVGLRAADIGAPHGRFRVFVLAWPRADAASVGRGTPGRDDGLRAAGLEPHAPADAAHLGHERGGPARDGWTGSPDGHGRGAAADAASDGRDEGRPEPARLVGRPDAAQCGADAAADADGDALREQSVAEPGRGGAAVAGLAGADAAAHTNGNRRRGRTEAVAPERTNRGQSRADREGHRALVAADANAGESSISEGTDSAALVGSRARAGARAGARRDASGAVAVEWGVYEPAIRQWERLTRPAPSPTEAGPKGGQRLSPSFTEWMQGWPDGWVTDVPGITRNEALKLCGNGVVPQQAAEAIRRMLSLSFKGAA